jgi:two-component system cell cycle response regulator DivK
MQPQSTTVLYIEDNIPNRVLIKRVLEAEGYVVVEAGSAQEGLELARSHQPDLILVDVNLPEIDGLTFTNRLRQDQRLKDVSVVALTANVMEGDRERTLSAGCDGYIQKPIDVDTFPNQVQRFLERASPARKNDNWQETTPDLSTSTILIVEDNVANFALMARLLGHLGVHCEWKTSGFEVVEYAETIPSVDLIIMDIRLPYEDGYEALQKLRQSKFADVPVLAVTAYSSEEQMARAKAAGFDGFVGKPLDPDLFPEQIVKVLTGQSVWELS